MVILFLGSASVAGSLATGFLGVPYGDAAVLETQPLPDCAANPELLVRWRCNHALGTTPVRVDFVVKDGYFTGSVIRGTGSVPCTDLMLSLKAAYGTGQWSTGSRGLLPDWLWNDGSVGALFTYNEISQDCTFLARDETVDALATAKQKERAAKAAEGLMGAGQSVAPAPAPRPPSPITTIICNDGTRSPSCMSCSRGCCSGHGGCQ